MRKPECIEEQVPLAPLTTFGIGGPARWLARPATRDGLAAAAGFARDRDVPLLVLGGGSNLLVADAGVEAVVVRLEGDFATVEPADADGLAWRVGAAAPLQALIGAAVRAGAGGLEHLAGIPGRVGGAAAMNAGGGNGDGLGRYVTSADVYDPAAGAFRTLDAGALRFGYRSSSLGGLVAVAFTLRLPGRDDPEALAARMREYRERKRAAQPMAVPSAGCVFKNPPGDSAGSLLDSAGCKGLGEGGARVSNLHANFIINEGRASSGDVARLAARMRAMVYDKSSVILEPEVLLWGDDPAFETLRRAPQ